MTRHLLRLVRRLRKVLASRDVSDGWLRDQERAEWRNTHEGVSWNWDAMKRRHDDVPERTA